MLYNQIQLARILEEAKNFYEQGFKKEHEQYLYTAISLIKNTRQIKEVLILEAICIDIYDINFILSNINKINNKLLACSSAISEFDLFTDNKDMFLEQFKNSRITNIKADGIFEKSVKEIIRYLGSEKNTALIEKITKEFFEARQNNLRNIVTDFTKARINFLSKQGLER